MTDNDLQVARDIGSLQADMRTVKHEVNNVSAKIDASHLSTNTKLDALSLQIAALNTDKAKGLSFIAGGTAVVTLLTGFILWLVSHIPGVKL